jgi:hypothetical protein
VSSAIDSDSVPAPSCGDGGGAQDSGRFSVASDGSKPSA